MWDKFVEVPKGLRSSFSIGLDSYKLIKSFSPANYYKSQQVHKFIISKYSQEIKLGRVSPSFLPIHAENLFGPY